MYPMQAIARTVPRSKHASIPILAQNAALVKSCKTVCDTRTNSSVDDSDSNRNSEEVRVIQSNETDSHTSSSSSGIQGKPTLHSDIDSTIDSSDGSTDPLLRKPEQHNSRNTKMFVSSQIHSGEVTMKHILFTFSKDPFEKIRCVELTILLISIPFDTQVLIFLGCHSKLLPLLLFTATLAPLVCAYPL